MKCIAVDSVRAEGAYAISEALKINRTLTKLKLGRDDHGMGL